MSCVIDQEFLQNIKISHQLFLNSIDQIQGQLRVYSRVKPFIREFQGQLLTHFSRQNKIFYDQLAAFVTDDPAALKMLEFLLQDLNELKVKTLMFFDLHSGELADLKPKNFPVDFMNYAKDVLMRMRMEEEYLFPILQKAIASLK